MREMYRLPDTHCKHKLLKAMSLRQQPVTVPGYLETRPEPHELDS